MSRHLSLTLLQYLVFLLIFGGSLMADDSSTRCNYNWDVQIGVVRNFMEQLASSRVRENELLVQISLLKAQLSQNSNKKSVPRNCVEAAADSFKSGVYKIRFERFSATPFEVFCNEEKDFGGWLVIQRCINDSMDFNRSWQAYKDGFGDLKGNYWIGLEKLHAFTTTCEHELYVEIERFDAEKLVAKYTEFIIGSESEGYALNKLGNYTGTAVHNLAHEIGMKFTTYDRDNDLTENANCAKVFKSAWWFKDCNFNRPDGEHENLILGIKWDTEKYGNMKSVQMMIRPTEKCLRRLSLRN